MSETLKHKTLRGTVWSSIERFSVQAVSFIVMIIMARILTPEVYSELNRDIEKNTDSPKEIELTSAIDAIRLKSGLVGTVLDGKMFDMGKPDAFQRCVSDYTYLY